LGGFDDSNERIADSHTDEYFWMDMYAAYLYASTKKYKKECNLKVEDQSDYFFECLFVLTVQFSICIAVYLSGEQKPKFTDDFGINLCIFFSNLALHFSFLCTIRNGLLIIKYSVMNQDDLDTPYGIFIVGVINVVFNIFCAIVNMLQSFK
jgi:hypothetical protein